MLSSTDTRIPINWVDPKNLLAPQRFDFAAKHIYARMRERNIKSEWGRAVYLFHLSIWNKFFEDIPRKLSEDDFLQSFNRIIDNTRNTPGEGLESLIPLARNGVPLNGAHRIAAALLFNKKIACSPTEIDPAVCYWDHRFFEEKSALSGHSETDFFDFMALEFCRLLPNIAIAAKFPAAKGHDDEVDNILSEHATIYYRKSALFRNKGPVHLIRTFYGKEPWLGTYEDGFRGAYEKTNSCFARQGPVRFFLLSYNNQDDLVRAKTRIRELFGISKHSIHITDNREEALRVAKLAFSNPSIDFINSRSMHKMPVFDTLLKIYRCALDNVEEPDDFCIDGSAVMAAYGIRDCRDIDYISHDKPLNIASDSLINSHNDYGHYYNKMLDEIIFNHLNHFYFEGIKFASLHNVRNWKFTRNEPKDREDIALIDAWVSRHSLSLVTTKIHLALHRSLKRGRKLARKLIKKVARI